MKKFSVSMLLAGLLTMLLAGCASSSGSSRPATAANSRLIASAKVHTELAGMYYERSQFGIALGEIDKALQVYRDYAPAYSVRGLIHMALREDKEAEEDFRHSVQLDKDNAETHNNYGWFLCQRGRAKESIEQFMAAVKNPLYETPERAWLNAGICSQKAGNMKEAAEFLQRALQVQPDFGPARLALAEQEFTNRNYVVAKRHFAAFAEKTGDEMTAEQLWLGVRIERAAGDRAAAATWGVQLRKRFPEAPETQKMMQGE